MNNNLTLNYRPISEIIRIFILPEIQKRIDDKRISLNDLPLELINFRAYQQKKSDGSINPVVELNEEVSLLCQTKLKNKEYDKNIIGQAVHINEINTEEFYVLPPEYEGKPCAYFYFTRVFLNPLFCFDCRPNDPDGDKTDLKLKYPIETLFKERDFAKVVKPYDKMDILIKNDWPPTPSYYPNVFGEMHKVNTDSSPDCLMGMIKKFFEKSFWDQRVLFWRDANFFAKRIVYIEKSIERYFGNDYVSSIYVLCPQFEGIIRDYLKENKIDLRNYKDNVDSLKEILYSRKVLLYPKKTLEIIFEYLKEGSFTQRTKKIMDPQKQVNRHGILHGIFSGFESEELALKLLLLLDSLAFILLSDKMALGKL